jgi:nucleotide-binding universal stress UspA family protein
VGNAHMRRTPPGMIEPETQGRSEDEDFRAVPEADGGRKPGGSSPIRAVPVRGKPSWVRNLLVAVRPDMSGSSALNAGAALAERTGAKLSAVSVVEALGSSEQVPPEADRVSEEVDSQSARVRTALEQKLERAGLKPKFVHVTSGHPAGLVGVFAEQSPTDLLIIGSHVSHGFESVRAGSTGEQIVKGSRLPVMVATRGGSSRFRRILIAVDLSNHSHSVLEWAHRLAWVDFSEVRVVHSEGPWKRLWKWLTFRGSRPFQGRPWQRFLGRFWELKFPGENRIFLRHGHAGRAVLREARVWNADLIVIGMRRFNWPSRARLGKTTKYVLRQGGRSTVVVPTEPRCHPSA